MAFWSDIKLREELGAHQLVVPFADDRIDCAAYRLAIGSEKFVSTSDSKGALIQTIDQLSPTGSFTIPPGQFAFLITEERVTVPANAIAFISIRANLKFRGLVNVSGFHVDPGYTGNLIFAVYNAGPSTIHLRRGDQVFLIWFADLDQANSVVYAGPGKTTIDSALAGNISREFKTLDSLSRRIESVHEALGIRIHSVEKDQRSTEGTVKVLIGLVIGLIAVTVTVMGMIFNAYSHLIPSETRGVGQANASPAPVASATQHQSRHVTR